MSILKSLSFDEICRRGVIRDADIATLRSLYYEDGRILGAEADALFEINDACRVQSPSWVEFFVEAITDYVVFDAEPEGYLTVANSEWLIARIEKDGRVCSLTELELLINVLDKARWAPERLSAFALDQVRRAVVAGEGLLRSGQKLVPGTITDADVELIRRVLYAFGSAGNVGVTRSEAEVLIAIDSATQGAAPNAMWCDLFVKAIASVVMCDSGYAVPSREEALHREAWLASRGDLTVAGMLKGMISTSLAEVFGLYREQSAEERAIARLERQRVAIITNEAVTDEEAGWLEKALLADGRLTPSERELLAYLKLNAASLSPSLNRLIVEAGIAA